MTTSIEALADQFGGIAEAENSEIVVVLLADNEGTVEVRTHGMTDFDCGVFFHSLAHQYLRGEVESHSENSVSVEIPEPVPATAHVANRTE